MSISVQKVQKLRNDEDDEEEEVAIAPLSTAHSSILSL
jgi:hypothetical protein